MGPDFYLFLRQKLDQETPLHWMTLEFLKSALEAALAETNPEETGYLPLPPHLTPKIPLPPEPSSLLNRRRSTWIPICQIIYRRTRI